MNVPKKINSYFKKIQHLERISDKISVFYMDGKKYLLKEMGPSYNETFCLEKQKYIDMLYQNGIMTAQIHLVISEGENTYELQEFLEDFFPINFFETDQIIMLSKYHNVSGQYTGMFTNLPVRPADTVVCGRHLDKLLIGFYEKYYKFPSKMLEIYILNQSARHQLYVLYTSIYKAFCASCEDSNCIIHNDLTSANMLYNKNNAYALIDFDFSTRSSAYVDFIDLLLTRNYSMQDYLYIFKRKHAEIETFIQIYNDYNPYIQLNLRGFFLMATLKLYAYAFYLYAPIHGLTTEETDLLISVGKYAIESP